MTAAISTFWKLPGLRRTNLPAQPTLPVEMRSLRNPGRPILVSREPSIERELLDTQRAAAIIPHQWQQAEPAAPGAAKADARCNTNRRTRR